MVRTRSWSLALLVVAFLGGCVATGVPGDTAATRKWMQAREAVSVIEVDLVALYRAQAISDRDLVRIDVYLRAARQSLERARLTLPAESSALDMAVVAVAEALARLEEVKARDLRGDSDGAPGGDEVDRLPEVHGEDGIGGGGG